jgi:circadian clock protein KaiC
MSSLVDTWLLVRGVELNGERNRALYVLKARGLAHSNQVREFKISSKGIRLVPAYIGPAGMTTGSARLAQEAQEKADRQLSADEIRRKELALQHRRKAIDAQIAALRADFKAEEQELGWAINKDKNRSASIASDRRAMARNRHAFPAE